MLKYMLGAGFAFFLVVTFLAKLNAPSEDYDTYACQSPPFTNVADRNEAIESGLTINPHYDCVDRAAFEAAKRLESEARLQHRVAQQSQPQPPIVQQEDDEVHGLALSQARKGFRTDLRVPNTAPLKLPEPPAELFVRSDYQSGEALLPAFVTPNPRDGQRHAAIVWLTGGDSNSLDTFWIEGPAGRDQSANAFRKASVVMMFPTLRGGNAGGNKEYFLGEVDDVLAAASHLASLPYVDPQQIYLGGYSTGGTLALLTAETGGRFAAVFAFGPVASVDRYPTSLFPGAKGPFAEQEIRLRSPIHWLHGLETPLYVIEGAMRPSNVDALDELCGMKLPLVRCVSVAGHDHFSVLTKVTPILAARIAVLTKPDALLKQAEFQQP
jgi:pimeloyl-ACP methyl ester carboxylesterase